MVNNHDGVRQMQSQPTTNAKPTQERRLDATPAKQGPLLKSTAGLNEKTPWQKYNVTMQCLPDHAKSVGRRDKFEISSTLRYSGSIWTSIYRLIKGDTTVYNEINLPDLGNVFECYISYIKKMIIVMTIVAATFLLTYTIITQTGIKTQKQPQSATMTCNQDINNSINLRRNVMRVMHEAKQNVRRWANYVNEDRANLTKSLDCRGKTANTSKTKMTSAIMIINNLEKEFKADNKLILRLTDTDSLTTSISSEKWPKTKSRNTRSKIPSEQPEDMRKQRSQKWTMNTSMETMVTKMTKMEEERDALQESVRMVAREMNQLREAFLSGAGASIDDDRRDDDERRSTSTRHSLSTSSTPPKSRRSTSSGQSSKHSSPESRSTAPTSPKRPCSRQWTPGSPEPKRRQQSPSENNRVIYPADYVTKKARND
ncbi:unnamed protein product [Caenorhabditis nigoni]